MINSVVGIRNGGKLLVNLSAFLRLEFIYDFYKVCKRDVRDAVKLARLFSTQSRCYGSPLLQVAPSKICHRPARVLSDLRLEQSAVHLVERSWSRRF